MAQKTGRALGAAATTVGQQAIELDHKLRLSERATAAGAAIKESAVGRSAGAAFGRVGSAVSASTKKVFENDKVGLVGVSMRAGGGTGCGRGGLCCVCWWGGWAGGRGVRCSAAACGVGSRAP